MSITYWADVGCPNTIMPCLPTSEIIYRYRKMNYRYRLINSRYPIHLSISIYHLPISVNGQSIYGYRQMIVGKSFTDIGKSFTDIDKSSTNIGESFTDIGDSRDQCFWHRIGAWMAQKSPIVKENFPLFGVVYIRGVMRLSLSEPIMTDITDEYLCHWVAICQWAHSLFYSEYIKCPQLPSRGTLHV